MRENSEQPLSRGLIYGVLYCLAGVAVGFGAGKVSGWLAVPIWLIAVFLFVAGLWTTLFNGAWLLLIHRADGKPRKLRR